MVRRERAADRISIVGPTTFSDESQADELLPHQMLFSLPDIRHRVAEVLNRWLNVSKKFRESFAVYFGSVYRPQGYTDLRFATAMHVLSLYQSERDESIDRGAFIDRLVRDFAEAAPRESVKRLADLLAAHPLITSERALRSLTQEHQSAFAPVAAMAGGQDFSTFVEYSLNTLRYTLTRKRPPGRFASSGAELYWLSELLAILFKISLLKELAFSADEIRALLDRNSQYTHIRDLVRPSAAWATAAST